MATDYTVTIQGPTITDEQGQAFVRALQKAMISEMANLNLGGHVQFPPTWYGIIVKPPTDPIENFQNITVNAPQS